MTRSRRRPASPRGSRPWRLLLYPSTALVIANTALLLAALVAGGPRSLTLVNEETDALTVDVLTGLGAT